MLHLSIDELAGSTWGESSAEHTQLLVVYRMKTNGRVIIAVSVLMSITWLSVHITFIHRGTSMIPVKLQKPLTIDLGKKLFFSLFTHAGIEQTYNMPYWRWLPVAVIDSRKNYPTFSLTVNPTRIENGGIVTIKWNNIPPHKHTPWLGLYCPSNLHSNNFIDYWLIDELFTPQSNRGQFNMTLYNIREDCQFRFFLNDTYTELIAESDIIKFIGGKGVPLHGHLALTGKADEMRVMWTSGLNITPVVRYGPCNEELSLCVSGSSTTYTAQDMCGPPANISFHFRHPGYLHDVLLTTLKPSTIYCYQYGSHGNQFSSVKTFRTALSAGEDQPFQFLVYGDMDITPSPGADTTSALVYKDVKNGASFVLHIGDICYSIGLAYRWDEFMSLITPISTHVPYMVSVGNHEQDTIVGGAKDPSGITNNGFHPSWGNYGHDSGGECGVPFSHRFHMPDNGNKLWWYSFEYGLAHITQLSSEHNFTRGSQQYDWLEQDLKSVDRNRTPWLIVTIHRPLYTIDKFYSDGIVTEHIRQSLEDLLYSYQVDLVIAGHYHSYERTCKVYHKKCVSNGIVHVVVGSAGSPIVDSSTYASDWSKHFEYSYGYGRLSVASSSALHWEFVRNKDGIVSDSLWLHK